LRKLQSVGLALAGPLANLALFAVAFAVIKVGLGTGTWEYSGAEWSIDRLVVPSAAEAGALEAISRLASITLILNLVLFLFNLLPLPPLDGSSVLAGLFGPGRRLRELLLDSPMGGFGGLILAWIVFPTLFRPVWSVVVAALYGGL